MFKSNYNKLIDSYKPTQKIINETINLSKETKKDRNTRCKKLQPVIIGLVFALSITFALPVLASEIKRIYELMYLAPPSVAEPFTPVEIYDESIGIKLCVVAIDISGNTAKIYITLEDLTGNRIDETITIDSYNVEGIGTAVLGSEFYGYEEDLKKATFMITIQDFENEDIKQSITDQLTFTLKEFNRENQGYGYEDKFKTPIQLESMVSDLNGTKEVRAMGASGDYKKYNEHEVFDGPATTIVPNIEPVSLGVEGFNLIGAAYKDGRLHLQTEVSTGNIYNDYDYLYLVKKGEITDINCLYSVGFANYDYMPTEDDTLFPLRYSEYVFDIPKDEIANYDVYGMFSIEGKVVEGNWEVSFPLEEIK